ncbi:hypothetical protein TNCV_2453951 [Trichonephila clavipes]|nr:hypothetical protein TNCV_2453951 [Trichonephila clavipes]
MEIYNQKIWFRLFWPFRAPAPSAQWINWLWVHEHIFFLRCVTTFILNIPKDGLGLLFGLTGPPFLAFLLVSAEIACVGDAGGRSHVTDRCRFSTPDCSTSPKFPPECTHPPRGLMNWHARVKSCDCAECSRASEHFGKSGDVRETALVRPTFDTF